MQQKKYNYLPTTTISALAKNEFSFATIIELKCFGANINKKCNYWVYAGTVKRHYVGLCRLHVAIDTGVNKLNVPYSPRYFNGIKIITASKCIF